MGSLLFVAGFFILILSGGVVAVRGIDRACAVCQAPVSSLRYHEPPLRKLVSFTVCASTHLKAPSPGAFFFCGQLTLLLPPEAMPEVG